MWHEIVRESFGQVERGALPTMLLGGWARASLAAYASNDRVTRKFLKVARNLSIVTSVTQFRAIVGR